MSYVIEIKGLTKDYEKGFLKKRKIRALKDLTLNVEPGQIFGFLGGNGAGKTTTIKLLMRLIFPTSGTARIFGKDISDVDMHADIGYCPENPYFYDYLKASELMNYFGELFGLDSAARKQKTVDLLSRVGLDEKDWNRQLRKFSKGMLQRVGIAQSLVNDPEIVFFDEPMSGLDPIGRREIRELIVELREKGTTVFMSSHILSDIEALCDNVAILRKGKLVAEGSLSSLLEAENQAFEIILRGKVDETLKNSLGSLSGVSVEEKPKGAAVQTDSENRIGQILELAQKTDCKLVSVQPVRQSLEELFVKEVEE